MIDRLNDAAPRGGGPGVNDQESAHNSASRISQTKPRPRPNGSLTDHVKAPRRSCETWIGDYLDAVRRANMLPKNARAALVGLVLHVSGQTGRAFPSNRTIADVVGRSERSIEQGMAILIDLGVIEVVYGGRGGFNAGGRGITTTRRINLERLKRMHGPPSLSKGAGEGREGRILNAERAHTRTGKGAPCAPKEVLKGKEEGEEKSSPTLVDEWGMSLLCNGEVTA